MVVTIRMEPRPGDSVITHLELIDPLAAPSLVHRMVRGKPAPASEPLRNIGELSAIAVTTLTQMSRGPRGGQQVRVEVPDAPKPPETGR
jgi:hypothetical protein